MLFMPSGGGALEAAAEAAPTQQPCAERVLLRALGGVAFVEEGRRLCGANTQSVFAI